jgi:hypothetical protein
MAHLFVSVCGIGVVVCLGTGLICAVRAGGPKGAVSYDWPDIAGHWRGWLRLGSAMIVVGLVGQWIAHVLA